MPLTSMMLEDSYHQRQARTKYVRGLLEFLILLALKVRQLSGYDVISFLYDTFRILLSSGTVYPALASLEKKGFIIGSILERRRIYRLTSLGEAMVAVNILEYSKFNEQLQLLSTHIGPHQAENQGIVRQR